MSTPVYRFLSLGAGVQSSTILVLACQGRIPRFDAAIFADTGWEPAAVYAHLARLTRIAERAGIPIVTVHKGHIRRDALDPQHRFASMPLWPPRVHDFWSRFGRELRQVGVSMGVESRSSWPLLSICGRARWLRLSPTDRDDVDEHLPPGSDPPTD